LRQSSSAIFVVALIAIALGVHVTLSFVVVTGASLFRIAFG
jgi:hypothetical protein